ncbi:Receptor-type tyrosine-protein phosphatase delta [Chionoecetes opilio]|uniref:Receptor-type tyrosine-protein phosphatase delta n=1 Tax=Chionoecetes opilio TaxID=41210 RepID=A0A8J4XP48_CHIOP|nr:Receptor-type tyrosine-protein phosphatase delta [Chionoecetes opilio]
MHVTLGCVENSSVMVWEEIGWNKAERDGGHIENCRVTEFGTGYIEFTWDFVEGTPDYPLHKYSLTTDSDLTSEFKCTSPTCSKTIEDLDACIEHTFELTPIFYDPSGNDIDGAICTTNGYTTDEIPGPVSNIRVTADTDAATSLKWNQPSVNSKCVDSYDVCFRLDKTTDTVCEEANSTQVTINSLAACSLYHVVVIPLTQSGMKGAKFEDEFTSHDGVPGKPQDVEVGLITPDTIQLLWNNPIENPACLERFYITIGETHSKMVKPMERKSGSYDNEFTFKPLFSCNNYTIDVCSANLAEMTSDKVIKYATTGETKPVGPPTVTVNPSGPNSIEVSWGDNENDRCSGSFEVCWSDGVHPVEQCHEIGGDGDNNFIIDDLLPCSNYDVSVTVQSPNGTFVSNSTSNSTLTQDIRPGPVVDLQVINIDTNRITINCQPPKVNPQCVKEIITRVIDENEKSLQIEKKSQYEETISGLKACTDYRVVVSIKSPSGLESEVREIRIRTLDDIPSEPQEFSVNEVTTTSITVQWFQPATNPRCASEYNLTWMDDTSDDTIIISDAPTFKVVYTLAGLQPCMNYNFTLNAESSVGEGPETTLSHSTAC